MALRIISERFGHSVSYTHPVIYHSFPCNCLNPELRLITLLPPSTDNISGTNGIVITGERPHFVLLTATGELRTHQFHHTIVMKSFAQFNNQNCANGLIYFDHRNELQIAVLPSNLTYDAPWPVRKVPLRRTPTAIVYHKESKVYCVSTYMEEESRHYFRFNGEDKELTEENKGERFIYPSKSSFEVLLVAPNKWEIVPDTSIKLDDWEHVVSFKNVHLAYEGTRHGFREYICVGTNFNYSEDITSRGRVSGNLNAFRGK